MVHDNLQKMKKEFVRNKETGILECWENGKKIGEIITMGDLVTRDNKNAETPQREDKELPKNKGKDH